MNLLILAAGRSRRFGSKIKNPKALIKIGNLSLIEKIIKDIKSEIQIDKINIIVGYKKEKIKYELKKYKIDYINNKDFKKREMLYSFYIGLKKNINKDILVSYSDIHFSKNILRKIKKKVFKKEILLPVQLNWKKIWKKRKKKITRDCESLRYNNKNYLINIGQKINDPKEVMGQYMGILYLPKKLIKKILKELKKVLIYKKLHVTDFLNIILRKHKILCIPLKDQWYEFDDFQDLKNFKYDIRSN